MRRLSTWCPAPAGVLIATLALAMPAAAQAPARAGVMGDLLTDISGAEEKMISLAEAIPADKFDWRPGEGVRSTSEVLMHVAADNFFLPTAAGVAAPEDTGIGSGADSYPTVQAFEQRKATKEQAIAEMRRSFEHLKAAMMDSPEASLDQDVDLFGSTMTTRRLWVLTTTHLHEHLGQLIAYARMNGVVPPWSR